MLKLSRVEKQFDDKQVLRGLSLELKMGEVVVLLGPSGCGKTTLLRIVAGLEQADSGSITLDGQDLSKTPVHQRGFGMVFQDYALFPHRNVWQNVAFGLRMRGDSEEHIKRRVAEVLRLVGLEGMDERAIFDLSGGEQQRVALARSLAPRPKLMLLDEPLGSLDRALRDRLMLDLYTILRQADDGSGAKMTAIYVTHDQSEAFALADRIVVMNAGVIEQVGTPQALFREPTTPFVAKFLGMPNVQSFSDLPPSIQKAVIERDNGQQIGNEEMFLIRPEAAELNASPSATIPFSGVLSSLSFRGRYQIVDVAASFQGDCNHVYRFELEAGVTLPAVGMPLQLYLRDDCIQRLA